MWYLIVSIPDFAIFLTFNEVDMRIYQSESDIHLFTEAARLR